MNFKKATDRVARASITLADIADAAGVPHQAIRRARMDPDSQHYRLPPEGWEKAMAKLVQKRATDLIKLADDLRRAAEKKR